MQGPARYALETILPCKIPPAQIQQSKKKSRVDKRRSVKIRKPIAQLSFCPSGVMAKEYWDPKAELLTA
jgi:hypothetical protein